MAKWTLTGTSPTIFNFVTSLLSTLSKTGLFLALSSVYSIFLAFHMSKGYQVPIGSLGDIPHSFFNVMFSVLKDPQISLATLALLAIFGCMEFSSTVAVLGLDFINVIEEGPLDTILTLSFDRRNKKRLLQTAGDPNSLRTHRVVGYTNPNSPTGWDMSWPGTALEFSFINALSGIARGASALAYYPPTGNDIVHVPWNWSGVPMTYALKAGGGPLASILLQIPLNCSGNEMTKLEQFQGYELETEFDEQPFADFRQQAEIALPNCTFDTLRSSGIYKGSNMEAYILEHAWSTRYISSVPSGSETIPLDVEYGLIQGGQAHRLISLAHEDKLLSKDRFRWQDGRTVPSVTGIRFGGLSILFDTSILGTGSEYIGFLSDWFGTADGTRTYNYFLVSTVKGGNCPPLPSGRAHSDLQCLVIVHLVCNQFPEDTEAYFGFTARGESSQCDVYTTHLLWGRNFQADSELAAVTAGVMSILKPDPLHGNNVEFHAIFRNAIPAALFAMANLEESTSNQIVVTPQVDGLYVAFMVLPVALALMLFVLYSLRRRSGKDIPISPYHMLLLGYQQRNKVDIPNVDPGDDFPARTNNRLVFVKLKEGNQTSRATLVTREDPFRLLQDPILRHFAGKMLEKMDNETEQKCWLRDRLNSQGKNLDIDFSGSHWEATVSNLINDRLQFLSKEERHQWFKSIADMDTFFPTQQSTTSGLDSKAEVSGQNTMNQEKQTLDESHTSKTWASDHCKLGPQEESSGEDENYSSGDDS